MRSTKVTVVASVLAGLMLPAGIAVATGKIRESRERKPGSLVKVNGEHVDTDEHGKFSRDVKLSRSGT